MPRPVMFDSISASRGKEAIEKEMHAKEKWIQAHRTQIWNAAVGQIRGRIQDICSDKTELLKKLMDSQDEYFKYCKADPQPQNECTPSDLFVVRVGPDLCDECVKDPTIPMRTPPDEVKALIFDGAGYKGYLRKRYDSGLPETKYCYPPTTNSEYAWKLQENVKQKAPERKPRLNSIGPSFYRSRGTLCQADFASFHFPRIY